MSHRQTLKVAAAQYPIDQPATLEAWRDKIARWVADGAQTGAEVLVFPEYAAIEQAAALGEKVYGDLDATLQAVAELEVDRVGLHQELAAKHRVHILVGSGPARKGEGRYVNAAQLVTPKGSVGVQEKLIMTPFETDWGISAGTQVRVFDTVLGLIGVTICYDSEFPLLARAMAEAGAEMLLVPSCTERLSGYHRVRTGSRARALENQIAAIVSPTVGDALWSPAVDRNTGAAGIYVPAEQTVSDTGVLAQGELNAAQWVAATVDLARLRHLRSSGEMRNYVDWPNQPGAVRLADKVEIVMLE
ncbi:MAG: carbon-nitrogen hydrolase family protein [Hyphomicrobium sp.]|uniref:carbon-nitrogen hydrolase family protein n=1 Tax=Hyphomicrobium sp. TaxID=82 RepID=UPI00132451A8|nr:carbon-nitrogen hydrolase family protein [Hyphomicrobium sp.]KAB2940780.1 MAG: carbon-nitrogen hydrolase family protein [Hyphomicrobium sp.]MBZ0211350.1 carbon-nitrogen hydrolase family protein [Hyphomicrobium sp.]